MRRVGWKQFHAGDKSYRKKLFQSDWAVAGTLLVLAICVMLMVGLGVKLEHAHEAYTAPAGGVFLGALIPALLFQLYLLNVLLATIHLYAASAVVMAMLALIGLAFGIPEALGYLKLLP